MFGATVPQWSCWVVGTLIGLLFQPEPELLEQLGVDVIFPAFFLLLVLEEMRSRRRGRWPRCVGPRSRAACCW